MGPMYLVVGGAKSYQGTVITRWPHRADIWSMDDTADDGWYRLQTNYDHWKPAPALDDRRTPGHAHMDAVGQDDMTIGNRHLRSTTVGLQATRIWMQWAKTI